jgi:hippurate hydrolase
MRLGLPAPKTKAGSQSGRTILLRADMDVLPMLEETGLEFASEIPGRVHACGHDSHIAMLMQAVYLLDRHRDEPPGTVKFVFQPGEEGPTTLLNPVEIGSCRESGLPRSAP